MPIFEIERDGKLYEVDAPDESAAASAFGAPQAASQSSQPKMQLSDYPEYFGGAATGVASILPGVPGNIEALIRGVTGGNPKTVMPTSSDVQNWMAGDNPSYYALLGRQAGELLGPPGARKVQAPPVAAARPVANPEVIALAQRAQQLGVPIRPAQASPTQAVKVIDDQLAGLSPALTGSSAAKPNKITPAAQHEAFTRAVSRTIGEDAPALTQDVMSNAQKRIGDIYKNVLPRNQVAMTTDLKTALDDIRTNAADALDEDSVKPVLTALDRIEKKMSGGALSGRQYQTMRARGGMISAVSDSQNTTVAHYGTKIREALDDAFQAQAQGDDGASLQQARQWLRNYKVLEPLAEKAPTGEISPALLLGEVRKAYPNFASEGAGDIGDLARIGQQFLKSPPNSQTATRNVVMRALENPTSTLAKAAAAPIIGTVGRAMNSAINSKAAASRLFNPIQNPGIVPGGAASVGGIDPRYLAAMSPQMLAALLAPSGQAAP